MLQQEDLLSEFNDELNQQPVSTGTRFVDYLVDIIIFYIIVFVVIRLMALDSPAILQGRRFITVIGYLLNLAYYTVLEGATAGRTLGKIVTGSKAIKSDGSDITWNDAFLRSLSRLVPFEQLSALGGKPWHDTWTRTTVIKK